MKAMHSGFQKQCVVVNTPAGQSAARKISENFTPGAFIELTNEEFDAVVMSHLAIVFPAIRLAHMEKEASAWPKMKALKTLVDSEVLACVQK